MLLHGLPRMDGHGQQPTVKNGPPLAVTQRLRDAITASITTLPEQLRRSLADQGVEMADRAAIDTGLPIDFCAQPLAAWRENTNGLLTSVLPQRHRPHSAEDLAAVLSRSTLDPARPSDGRLPPRHSTNTYSPLHKAVLRRPLEPEQYTSWAFGHRLRTAGLLGSMGRVASAVDNSMMESFFGTLQLELLDRRSWTTRAELASAIFEWIEGWYNPRRRHTSIGDLSPVEYERRPAAAAEAA